MREDGGGHCFQVYFPTFKKTHILSAGSQWAAKASGLSYIYLCSILTKMA